MNPFSALPVTFLIVYGVICAIFWTLTLVSMWKIYVKMGVPGWKGIVPFYNLWVMIEALRKPKSWFWIILSGYILYFAYYSILYIPGISEDMMTYGNPISRLLFSLLVLAMLIVLLVYAIRLTHALSQAFGHGAGFTVGLILLPMIFLPILAFGPDRFQREE